MNTIRETHMMFIDFQKAYDKVPAFQFWEMLQETNISQILIKILKILYDESMSQIKLVNERFQAFIVNKELRQGRCVSPTLFKVYVAKALQTWKRKCNGVGVDLRGVWLYTLQFTDDQIIMAKDMEYLQYVARKLQKEYKNGD